jgi:hypothetical protein
MAGMSEWWTPADSAELDVLVDALLDAVYMHREQCKICATGGPWCDALRDCLQIVQEWRRSRDRLSKAEHLRVKAAA